MNHKDIFAAVLSLCPGAKFSLIEIDGLDVVHWADDSLVQPTEEEITAEHERLNSDAFLLSALKIEKLAEINWAAEKIALLLTAGYPEFEKQTWESQQREALAWADDDTVATPRIDALAGFRGIDRVLYLQKTLSKVQAFIQASNYLAGTRQKYADQVAAATTAEQVAAVKPLFSLGV